MNFTTQTVAVTQDQVESGKLFAILSYVVPFFFLVPLIQRENRFAHFHARQVLGFVMFALALNILLPLLPVILPGVLGSTLLMLQVALLVFGIYHAAVGRATQLPVVGPLSEKVLAKINAPQLAAL